SSVRNAGAAGDGRFALQIFGTKGVAEINTGHPARCFILQDPAWSPGRSSRQWIPVTSAGLNKPEPLPNTGLHGGNVLAVNNLIDCIEQPEQSPLCNVYDARWTIEMISAVFESHRLGRPVTLPLENRECPLTLMSQAE
ncbi:MAG: hypothetical protein R3C01_08315, partial [Planctomycetaceae bacterium]